MRRSPPSPASLLAARDTRPDDGLELGERLGGRAAAAGPARAGLHARDQDGKTRHAARRCAASRSCSRSSTRPAATPARRRCRRSAARSTTLDDPDVARGRRSRVDPANDTPKRARVVPAQAADDRPDAVPARHARAARAGLEGVRDPAAAERASSTPRTPCSPTPSGLQRIGFPFDQLTEDGARARPRPAARVSGRFDELKFFGEWRPYQRAALAAFEKDRQQRQHVARTSSRRPGSGKTLLGVELIRRVGKRALVLAPNQGIQQQWPRAVGEFTPQPGGGRRRRPAEADRLPLLPGAVPARGPGDRARPARAVALGGRARRGHRA